MRAGPVLLALFLATAILLGPWAAKWLLAGIWFVCAGVFGYVGFQLRHSEPATSSLGSFALAIGFAGLAAATAYRALGGSTTLLPGLLYLVAGIGMIASFVLERSLGRPALTDGGSDPVDTAS